MQKQVRGSGSAPLTGAIDADLASVVLTHILMLNHDRVAYKGIPNLNVLISCAFCRRGLETPIDRRDSGLTRSG